MRGGRRNGLYMYEGQYNVGTNDPPDLTGFNIIEDGTNEFDGHAGLELAGHNDYVQNVWCLNYPWYEATWCKAWTNPAGFVLTNYTWWGGREIAIGGAFESNTVFQNFHIDYSGWVPDQPGALDIENGGNNIVREGEISCASGVGLMVYGDSRGGVSGSNACYNISIALCASNITFYTSSNLVQVSYPEYQHAIFCYQSSNNFFANILCWQNFNNAPYLDDSGEVKDWRSVWTTTNPNFVSLANSIDSPLSYEDASAVVYPNLELESGSPAYEAGTELAYISSDSGSGTSFTVYSNANYFSAGLTACTRYIPGDTIQFKMETNQPPPGPPPPGPPTNSPGMAVIKSIDGNTITVTLMTTWTNGGGIALPYTGASPNVGAY